MATIGATIYKMGIDTSQFQAASVLTRKEMALTRQVMKETASATDNYNAALSKIDTLVAKNAITLSQRNEVMSQMTQEHLRQIPVVGNFASAMYAMGPAGAAAAAGSAGLAVALREVSQQMGVIDALINMATNVGIAADKFQQLAGAADFADIETNTFAGGVEKMLGAISKANEGLPKMVKVFGLLGQDAKQLHEIDPAAAFEQIVTALGKMDNAADRVRVATAIFGSPDFARISTENIARARQNIEAMGGAVDELRSGAFGRMDDALTDLTQKWDAFWKNQTLGSSSAVAASAGAVNDLLNATGAGNMSLLDEAMRGSLMPFGAAGLLAGRFGGGAGVVAGAPAAAGGASLREIEARELAEKQAEEAEKTLMEERTAGLMELWESQERDVEEARKREHELAETRKKLWDDGVAEWRKGYDAMIADAKKLGDAEASARLTLEEMEVDRSERAMRRVEAARTTDVALRGSAEAAKAIAQYRAPAVVKDPEMTREQKKAVELLKRIAAGVENPLMVVEETL